MKHKYLWVAITFTMGMLFGSCSRDSEASDPLMSTSEDNAEVSAMFDDIDAEADDAAAIKLKNTPADSNTYRTIEDTLINDTLFITVTYKNWQNPSSNNVRIKNGDILIRIYGGYASDSLPYFKQITFKNFTINGNKIEGIRTIEKDPENNKVYHITLTNGKVTFLEDNTTYTRSTETRTRTWVAGFETPFSVWDDEYDITGSASGVNRQEKAYTLAITTALHVKLGCPCIVSGVISYNVDGKESSLNYGDGNCDRMAKLTIGEKNYDIILKGGK